MAAAARIDLQVNPYLRFDIKQYNQFFSRNRNELLEAVKTGYPDFIATTNPEGTPPANPPTGDNKTYTREQIRTMSPEEINKNWDSIKKNLASLK